MHGIFRNHEIRELEEMPTRPGIFGISWDSLKMPMKKWYYSVTCEDFCSKFEIWNLHHTQTWISEWNAKNELKIESDSCTTSSKITGPPPQCKIEVDMQRLLKFEIWNTHQTQTWINEWNTKNELKIEWDSCTIFKSGTFQILTFRVILVYWIQKTFVRYVKF